MCLSIQSSVLFGSVLVNARFILPSFRVVYFVEVVNHKLQRT